MTSARLFSKCVGLAVCCSAGFSSVGWAQAPQPVPPEPVPADIPADRVSDLESVDGVEVLLHGPLHEAYAEPFAGETEPGFVVEKRPPEPIDEIPPDYRPEGEDVIWIPGYWGWNFDQEEFVWVTGIWRQVPPDRQWIPGYWAEVEQGSAWQWISGYFAPLSQQQASYLPPPPEAVEDQPSSAAPGEDYFWIPGQWRWMENDYRWRAGYWSQGYESWVWVPARYVWTPSGVIYRPGYWDYTLPNRGVVFCPVRIAQPVQIVRYQPRYVVNSGLDLLVHLFVMPRYRHYYFGNYYNSSLLGQNLYPWVSYNRNAFGADPLYTYYQYRYRNLGYLDRVDRIHRYYAENAALRPALSLVAQQRNLRTLSPAQRSTTLLATTLQQLATDQGNAEWARGFQRVELDADARREQWANPWRERRLQREEAEVTRDDRPRNDRVRENAPRENAPRDFGDGNGRPNLEGEAGRLRDRPRDSQRPNQMPVPGITDEVNPVPPATNPFRPLNRDGNATSPRAPVREVEGINPAPDRANRPPTAGPAADRGSRSPDPLMQERQPGVQEVENFLERSRVERGQPNVPRGRGHPLNRNGVAPPPLQEVVPDGVAPGTSLRDRLPHQIQGRPNIRPEGPAYRPGTDTSFELDMRELRQQSAREAERPRQGRGRGRPPAAPNAPQ